RPSRRRAGKVAAARWADDLAVSRHELAGLDGRDRPAPQRLALERREIRHAAQVFGANDFLEGEIGDDEIGVGARRDRAFARKDAVGPRGRAGGEIDEALERDAMATAVMQQDRKMRAERGMAWARAVQARLGTFRGAPPRGVVGADRLDGAV